jgi:hypothetical protein
MIRRVKKRKFPLMFHRTLIALVMAVTVFAAPAWAVDPSINQSSAQPAPEASSSFKLWNVTIRMTPNSGSYPGACTDGTAGYANFCPASPCTCFSFSGTAAGATGKGTVNFYETYDTGAAFVGRGYACASAYGEIDIAGEKDTEAISFVGTDCRGLAPAFLTGGCQIGESNVYISGQGQCSGLYSTTAKKMFKIKGIVEKQMP